MVSRLLWFSNPAPLQQLEGSFKSISKNSPVASYVTQSNDQIPSLVHRLCGLCKCFNFTQIFLWVLSPITSLSLPAFGLFAVLELSYIPLHELSLSLEHSSPDMCISHPLPPLNTSAQGTPSQPGLPDPPILNYSNPTPTPGTSYISLCFCFSSRHFLSSEMRAFYQCVSCLSPSIQ